MNQAQKSPLPEQEGCPAAVTDSAAPLPADGCTAARRNGRLSFKHTIYASYLGYVTQAIVNSFVPLLFLTFQSSFGLSLDQITLLITVNFSIQLLVDLFAAKYVDRLGYRRCIVAAHFFAAGGLVCLSFLPDLLPPYIGILLSVSLYGIGGGLIEVLVSPLVEACPTEGKAGNMSLLHSFFCWGQVFVVLFSTFCFHFFGIENWRYLALFWAVLPAANAVYFAFVPIATLVESDQRLPLSALFKNKMFWLLCLLMVCAGASELGMYQWASAFAEAGLGVSKTIGDLAGPCVFAVLMGLTRTFYGKCSDKIPLQRFMAVSSVCCVVSYLLASLTKNPVLGLVGCGLCGISVGIMWPGTFTTAAKALPRGGTAMFAILALAGDLGCIAGPTLVGVVSETAGENLKLGLLSAGVFPLLLLAGLFLLRRVRSKQEHT